MRILWPMRDRRQHVRTSVLLAVVVVGLLSGVAQSARAASPKGTLEAFFARTNTILESVDPARGLAAPRQAICDLVNEVFDFRAAAAVALGPVWLSRTPKDQDEFTRLFAILLERGYIAMVGSKASVAGGVRIRYLDESIDGESARVATTLLTRGGQELPVDYWMVRRGDRWKVQDVVVDGVSLVLNYRAQFARVLAASAYAGLVARMQAQTLSAPPSPAYLAAPSAPSTLQPAGNAQPQAAAVGAAPEDRSVKPKMVKPGQSEQRASKSRSGGAKREDRSTAVRSNPVPAAPKVAASGATQRPVDLSGRLLVKSRSGAERDLAALLQRAGGTTLSQQRGPTITVVKAVVPHPNYGTLAAGLRSIGSWRPEAQRVPLPDPFHVAVRLAE